MTYTYFWDSNGFNGRMMSLPYHNLTQWTSEELFTLLDGNTEIYGHCRLFHAVYFTIAIMIL